MIPDRLIDLNPWVEPLAAAFAELRPGAFDALARAADFSSVTAGPAAAILQARRAFHRGRLGDEPTRWNRWARDMQASDGGWLRASRSRMVWQLLAHVDLSGASFADDIDLAGRVFPGALSLVDTIAERNVYLSGSELAGPLVATSLCVGRDFWFDQLRCAGDVGFDGAQFAGRVEARASRYGGTASFRAAQFRRDSWFSGSQFDREADFTDCQFLSDAGFSGCRFGAVARFENVCFGDTSGMESCIFRGDLLLRSARFEKGIFFNDAEFAREPVIDGASFARAPRLTGARFPDATRQPDVPTLRRTGSGG